MGIHISLLLHTTDDQGLTVSVMTEKITYFREVKNKPDQCEVVFYGGQSLTVMMSHDDFSKAVHLLEGVYIKSISDYEIS